MNKKTIILKYGGNAMTNKNVQKDLVKEICHLKEKGNDIVIVHGGGPFIQEALDDAEIHSEFIDGQRKTSTEALKKVEMVLKGQVNGVLVNLINTLGFKAVGLSGKDGRMVIARKRYHHKTENGQTQQIDLGQVGDVDHVNPGLLNLLIKNDFIPVITCLASDEKGNDFNINGDVFAGHIAAALEADEYIVLTDVDGLLEDIQNPGSLITDIRVEEIASMIDRKIISGGMIPKIEACITALENGARSVRIINGTQPAQLGDVAHHGTRITK